VRLLEQTRVSRIKAAPDGADGWWLQHTQGELTAPRVVLATNGYSTGLGVGSNRLVVPVGSYIVASHPLEPHAVQQFGAHPTVFSTSGRFPNYFRLVTDAVTGSARLLFGGRRSLSYESSPQRVVTDLLEDVRRVLPGVPFNVERVWGGRLAFTAHREPQMGEIERGLYFAGGCCGHGVPTSIACANALASVLLEKADAPPVFYRRKLSRSFAMAAASKLLPLIGTYYRARDRLDALQVTC
jgi:gamma-glutamylputrescine oxidase